MKKCKQCSKSFKKWTVDDIKWSLVIGQSFECTDCICSDCFIKEARRRGYKTIEKDITFEKYNFVRPSGFKNSIQTSDDSIKSDE